MFFLIFPSFIASEIGNYDIRPTNTLLFFSSFGFTENSNFSMSIHSSIPIKLNLFLFSYNELRNTASRHVFKTCNSSKVKVANINKTFNVSKQNFVWSGNIQKQDVYYPIILFCTYNLSSLKVNYQFCNKDFLVDFRSEKNSLIYLYFTLINLVLGFSWIINILIKPNFSIAIQQIMSFLPIVKAIADSLMASEWEEKKFSDNISQIQKSIPIAFNILFYVLFMYITTLGFSGWCIFRMDLGYFEKTQIFLSSFFCVFGLNIGNIIGNNLSSLVPILFTCAGFLWYMKLNATYLATLIQLSESNIESERMKSRIKMTQNFSVSSFSLVVIIILAQSGTLSFDLWPIVGIIIQEVGIISLEIVQMYFFYLRDDFVGEVDESQKEVSVPYLLVEPQKNQIVFLSQDNEKECSL